VRGSVGFLIGTLLGGMIGGGVAFAVSASKFEFAHPIEAADRATTMTIVATGVTVLGAVSGIALGAWKPDC
jgi:hypothetical protein